MNVRRLRALAWAVGLLAVVGFVVVTVCAVVFGAHLLAFLTGLFTTHAAGAGPGPP